jgi:hypothetical protein
LKFLQYQHRRNSIKYPSAGFFIFLSFQKSYGPTTRRDSISRPMTL